MAAIPSSHRFEAAALGHCEDDGEAGRGTLAEAQAGDARAFTRIVQTHQRSVYSLALRALGSRPEAEDVAQEVFLQLHLGLDRIESPQHLAYWLRRTAAHRSIDRLRQRNRHPQAQEPPLDPAVDPALGIDSATAPTDAEDPILARRLRGLVAELPAIPRLIVILRFQEDLDPAEIARALDLSVNTVKSHLKRSLARLRARCTSRDTL